jgi:hypothetical protein
MSDHEHVHTPHTQTHTQTQKHIHAHTLPHLYTVHPYIPKENSHNQKEKHADTNGKHLTLRKKHADKHTIRKGQNNVSANIIITTHMYVYGCSHMHTMAVLLAVPIKPLVIIEFGVFRHFWGMYVSIYVRVYV